MILPVANLCDLISTVSSLLHVPDTQTLLLVLEHIQLIPNIELSTCSSLCLQHTHLTPALAPLSHWCSSPGCGIPLNGYVFTLSLSHPPPYVTEWHTQLSRLTSLTTPSPYLSVYVHLINEDSF